MALVLAAVCDESEPLPEQADPVEIATPDDGKLRVGLIKPAEAFPGAAVVVHHSGTDPGGAATIRVEVSKRPAEVLQREEDYVVVRVPTDIAAGPAKVRVFDGERRSKPKGIRVKQRRLRRILRYLAGGLALLVFGLRTLARGMRGYAGHPMRAMLARWTKGPVRSLAIGTAAGSVAQSVVSAAAFVVGLLQSRLLTFSAALVILLGVHIGAGTAVLVLPIGTSRESLWVIALGVVLVTLARTRRGESAGNILVGLGMLFYGLALLRDGFHPIIGDPGMLPYLEAIREDGVVGLLTRVGAGTVAGAMLQGPGAAFGLVLSVGESTALLNERQSLEIMAATNFGASLGTLLIALPMGRTARRLAVAHVCAAAAVSAIFIAIVGPATSLSSAILPTDPNVIAYGKKVLLPNFGEHLALSFATAQLCSIGLVAPLAVLWSRKMNHRRGSALLPPTNRTNGPDESVVARALRCGERTLAATMELLTTGARMQAMAGEEEIARVRAEMKDAAPRLAAQLPAAVAVLQLQQSLEQLQRIAERGIEKDYLVDPDSIRAFREVHDLVAGGLERAIRHVEDLEPLDMEAARGQEIATNATEAECRAKLLATLGESPADARALLWRIEVLSAYESVGNHVYRVADVLAGPEDEF